MPPLSEDLIKQWLSGDVTARYQGRESFILSDEKIPTLQGWTIERFPAMLYLEKEGVRGGINCELKDEGGHLQMIYKYGYSDDDGIPVSRQTLFDREMWREMKPKYEAGEFESEDQRIIFVSANEIFSQLDKDLVD